MRTPQSRVLGGLAVLTGMVASASGASAQANCDTYGKLAIQQQQENVQLKCGFSGPEWSPDLKAHIGELRLALRREAALAARTLERLEPLLLRFETEDLLDLQADYSELFDR